MSIKIRNSKFEARNEFRFGFRASCFVLPAKRGYTLVELIIAVGLFALVMTLVSGAYIVMIGLTERAQSTATGIDNLSFALETMTRNIRMGKDYSCNGGDDCSSGGSTFSFTNSKGVPVVYSLIGNTIRQTVNNLPSILTDPSVTVSTLLFYVSGTTPGDVYQPHVTIIASGSVSSGKGDIEYFTVETGATMRTPDL